MFHRALKGHAKHVHIRHGVDVKGEIALSQTLGVFGHFALVIDHLAERVGQAADFIAALVFDVVGQIAFSQVIGGIGQGVHRFGNAVGEENRYAGDQQA